MNHRLLSRDLPRRRGLAAARRLILVTLALAPCLAARTGIGKILSPAQVPDGVTAPSFISTVALGLAAAATATPTQTWLELV